MIAGVVGSKIGACPVSHTRARIRTHTHTHSPTLAPRSLEDPTRNLPPLSYPHSQRALPPPHPRACTSRVRVRRSRVITHTHTQLRERERGRRRAAALRGCARRLMGCATAGGGERATGWGVPVTRGQISVTASVSGRGRLVRARS